MPPAVIDQVNLLGQCKPAMLTFTYQQGRDISDSNLQDANSIGILDDNLIIINPAVEIPGVDAWIWTPMCGPWTPMCGPWTPMPQLTIMLLLQ
jgi:hypothetical protein